MRFLSSQRMALLCLIAGTTALSAVAPTDNPIETYYAGDPHLADYGWVDDMAWENVHNILDYGAVADGNDIGNGVGVTDNVAAFHAAVAAVYAEGGGVVYIPAGTYYFSDHLYLKSGVVIRGDTPVVTNAHSTDFAPPTKLEFPRYFFDPTANDGAGVANSTAFKFIYAEDNSFSSKMGLVWLDINRAGISMSSEDEGTENRLVFGTRTNNVANPDPTVPTLTKSINGVVKDFQLPWQRYSHRFARNIHVLAQRNVLVANNRANDKHFNIDHQLPGWESLVIDDFLQVGYILQDTKRAFGSDSNAFVALQAQHLPLFSYTNHYGIYVRGSAGSVWGAAPYETPSLFLTGMTIRDNWVYTTMRVGIHVSGWGLKVLNNVKEDKAGKIWWIHPTGTASLQGATTLENRGLDISGSRILVEGNNLEAQRHRVNNGSYLSTDGEGILVQECCGGTTLDDVIIRNNTSNAYIGVYKMPYTRNIQVVGNTFTPGAFLMINANKNNTRAPIFDILVEDNVFESTGGINVTGLSGGNGVTIINNTMNGGGITYPAGISTVTGNTGHGNLNPIAIGDVRDYPVLELEDPSTNGLMEPAGTVVKARVTGSYLNRTPANSTELPNINLVEIYVNSTLLESFTTNTIDPNSTAWLYEADWFPAPGFYLLSARAVPAGYSGPLTSTEWFTVSDVIPVHVTGGTSSEIFYDWQEFYFPGESDPLIVGDDADADGDGLPTLVEFFVGGDPTTPNSHLAPTVIRSEDSTKLRFRMRDDLGSKVHYTVQSSTDLQNWTNVPKTALTGVSAAGLPAGVQEYEYTLPSNPSAPTMMRLQIRRKP